MKKIVTTIALIVLAITANCQVKRDQTFDVLVRFNKGIQFGDGSIQLSAATGAGLVTWESILNKPLTFAPDAHNQAWSTITGRPTTLAGYGITDASSIIHTHSTLYKPLDYVPTWAEILNKPIFPTVAITGNYYDLVNLPDSIDLDVAIPLLDGVCLPVLTATEIGALAPVKGTILWNETDNVLQIYTGTTWKIIISGN